MNDWAYFDYAATTPPDSEVLEIYFKNLKENFANPSSPYDLGLKSKESLENARAKIAEVLGVQSAEIIFLSGATEADNLALKGFLTHRDNKNPYLITSPTEHKAILDTASFLARQGIKIDFLNLDKNGIVDLNHLEELLKKGQSPLISLMAVNNETGIIQPLAEVGKLSQKYGAKFHIDAAQASGRIKLEIENWGADAVSLCGHKVYAPKGIGVLFTKRFPKFRLSPQIHGGGQERNLRSGTNALALANAFAFALEKFGKLNLEENNLKVKNLRDYFLNNLPSDIFSNVDIKKAVPHILSLSTKRNFSQILPLANSQKIALSAGSACNSDFFSGSYVLKAIEIKNPENALRISFSHLTNNEEVKRLINFLV